MLAKPPVAHRAVHGRLARNNPVARVPFPSSSKRRRAWEPTHKQSTSPQRAEITRETIGDSGDLAEQGRELIMPPPVAAELRTQRLPVGVLLQEPAIQSGEVGSDAHAEGRTFRQLRGRRPQRSIVIAHVLIARVHEAQEPDAIHEIAEAPGDNTRLAGASPQVPATAHDEQAQRVGGHCGAGVALQKQRELGAAFVAHAAERASARSWGESPRTCFRLFPRLFVVPSAFRTLRADASRCE